MQIKDKKRVSARGCTGKHMGVLGLGVTGKAAVEALLRGGSKMVTVWDDDGDRVSALMGGIGSERVRSLDLGRSESWIFDDERLEYVVVSPGIDSGHKVRGVLQGQMIRVESDIDLLWDACPGAFYIGVTGSNGKSTVVSLVEQVLRASGVEAFAGGNYGRAALSLPELGRGGVYVIEMSSFQLEMTKRVKFSAAALLNFFTNHDEWHGSLEAYRRTKFKIFHRMEEDAFHVVGTSDEYCLNVAQAFFDVGVKAVPVSSGGFFPCGVFWVGDKMFDGSSKDFEQALGLDDIANLTGGVRGSHVLDNIAAAYALLRAYGLERGKIARGLGEAELLRHRMERVGDMGGGKVSFINDSKATNLAAVSVALRAFKNIFWIAGGRSKGGDFTVLGRDIESVRRAYFIGEAAGDLLSFASSVSLRGEVYETLEEAVREAHRDAEALGEEAVVLLAPGCSSYDMFENFEERGEVFCEVVKGLGASGGAGGGGELGGTKC